MGSASVTKAPPSSSSSPHSSSTESLDGLKFGQKIYFEEVSVAAAAATTTQGGNKTRGGVSASKKGRGGSVQAPRCQVAGCKVDLSGAKAYYSRHKVCAMHSKSPTVTVAGLEQRFCQQCSRSPLISFSLSHFLLFYLLLTSKRNKKIFFCFFFFFSWLVILGSSASALVYFPHLTPWFLLFLVFLLFWVLLEYCYAIHTLFLEKKIMVFVFLSNFYILFFCGFGCIFYIACFSFQGFNRADFVLCRFFLFYFLC